ncbi:WD40 repeat-like protein, partial [Auricularia subglabra TFB-10046 SS5]
SVLSVAFSPDGTCVASGSGDDTVCRWDSATGAHLASFKGHSSSVYSICFLPDGIHLVSGS